MCMRVCSLPGGDNPPTHLLPPQRVACQYLFLRCTWSTPLDISEVPPWFIEAYWTSSECGLDGDSGWDGCRCTMRVIFLMLIGPNAPRRPCELASQLGGVIWGAEMVVRLENELILVHVLDG